VTPPDPLPAVFHERFAGLDELAFTARPGDLFHECFGCGTAHPNGLRVRCFRTAEGVASPVLIAGAYAGPPGVAHGGIVATYFDEILAGAVVRATGRVSVTGELTVRYVRPVPVDTPMLGRGRLVADHGRYVDVEATLETLATGETLATARGRFFPLRDGTGGPVRRA
jgi:acyl-coenzyme A thioesterase PaaI-like protein